MLWTWDKTDAVVRCGLVSAVLTVAARAVISSCCWSSFFILWGALATLYVISAFPQVSTKGRAVLITGCDSGFGLHLALHLHKLGFRVFAGCLQADGRGRAGAESLQKLKSDRLHVVQLDVTSQAQVDKAVKEVKKILPDGEVLWGLVNNAGWATYGDVEWVSLDTVSRIVDVNVLGLIAVTKAFLPLLRRSKGTSIFTEASIREMAAKMWESMDPEVKADYGRERFEARVQLMKSYSNSGDTDVTPVLNAFTEGLVQRWPQVRYNPMNVYFRTRVFIATHLPECIYEKIYVG
ncbi:hypothetical protein O3P69_003280 [Scylla paramamosain]|uniref:D-beta-hydroxybutyrate dehydrogenase, mitochondrial n=1 Tax=Scylla paramamosain TaxID=85552 RepID=A0AAW0UQM2_SCYPA